MTYRGNIPRFYAYVGLTRFVLWMPIWVIFLERRGLSLSQIGTLEFVAILTLAAFEVPTGTVADLWGRKLSLAIGACLHGLALLGLLTEVLSPVFLVAYVVWGVSFSFVSGASEAFAYDSLKADGVADHFPRVASRYAMIQQAAGGFSGLVGGLVATYDIRLCFLITAVACFVGAGVILTGHEPPGDHVPGADRPGYRTTLVAGARIAIGRPRVRAIILLAATIQLFVILLTMTAFQPYANEVALPLWTFGAIYLGIQAFAIAGSYLSPRAAIRFGRARLLTVATIAIAGCQVLLWLGASRPAVVLIAVTAAVSALVQPILSAMLNDAIPSRQRATIISLQSLVAMVGLGVVQLALFTIGQRTSMALAIGLAGMLMAVLAAPSLAVLARSPAEPDESAIPVMGHP